MLLDIVQDIPEAAHSTVDAFGYLFLALWWHEVQARHPFEKGEISSEETEKIQEENEEAIADKELAPQEEHEKEKEAALQ